MVGRHGSLQTCRGGPADTYVSVAVELALSAAEAVARLVLRAGKRPPGGGEIRKPSAPPRAVVAAA